MYPTVSWPCVVTFYVDQKSNMAILAFEWLIYYKLIILGHFVLSFCLHLQIAFFNPEICIHIEIQVSDTDPLGLFLTYITKIHLFFKSILICKPKQGSVISYHKES